MTQISNVGDNVVIKKTHYTGKPDNVLYTAPVCIKDCLRYKANKTVIVELIYFGLHIYR